jgi:RNase P/RNase MRP subunit p29
MNARTRWTNTWLMLLVAGVWLASTLSMTAQVKSNTSETSHDATVETSVARGEVVYVSGNDLVVKMEDGTLRHINNVPESARATVDGKEIGIHDVKVGMKLEKTITTTTTPKTITTVQTVTGKVWHVNPPTSVILSLEDGTNQKFNIPKDQKFDVDGQKVDAWGLKKGMKISATKIVEEPVTQVEQEAKVSGQMPPPPPAPPAEAPILVAVAAPAPAAPAAPAELPKTGSPLVLIGLLGALSTAASFGLRVIRKG